MRHVQNICKPPSTSSSVLVSQSRNDFKGPNEAHAKKQFEVHDEFFHFWGSFSTSHVEFLSLIGGPKVIQNYLKLPKITHIVTKSYSKLLKITQSYLKLPKLPEVNLIYQKLPEVTQSYQILPNVT